MLCCGAKVINRKLLLVDKQKDWIKDMDTFALRIFVDNDIIGLGDEEEEVEDIRCLKCSRK